MTNFVFPVVATPVIDARWTVIAQQTTPRLFAAVGSSGEFTSLGACLVVAEFARRVARCDESFLAFRFLRQA
jgi:hypothetical protein